MNDKIFKLRLALNCACSPEVTHLVLIEVLDIVHQQQIELDALNIVVVELMKDKDASDKSISRSDSSPT